jgi:molybdopterin/thiamine biosynthesis adenylyltransferase
LNNAGKTSYEELFARNYGVFSEQEQERLRKSRILIVGCGGIGGTVALILARSGIEKFILVEFDAYDTTNMNRQISCFADTLGRNKAEVIGDDILRINPHAEVEIYPRLLNHTEIGQLIPRVDIVFPAADDYAFSILIFREAKRQGKPALFVVPSGTWANVSIILPEGPSIEKVEGIPPLETYEELKQMFQTRKYKYGTYYYTFLAGWRIDYYRRFLDDDLPPTQLCPVVWLCSSIGAFEVIKLVSRRWKPVAAPRFWFITQNKIKVLNINGVSMHTFLLWQRRLHWMLFQTPLKGLLERIQNSFLEALLKVMGKKKGEG